MVTPITYLSARLVDGPRCYVVYHVLRPGTDRLERQRVYFDREKNLTHRRRQSKAFIKEINEMLAKGWNPFVEGNAPRMTDRMSAMFSLFLDMKAKTLRDRSLPNYRSRIKRLQEWMVTKGMADPPCCEFTERHASEFIDSLIMTDLKARTCNNYINDLKGVGNWAVKRGYWPKNPFEGLEPLREDQNELRPLVQQEIDMMLDSFKSGPRPGMTIVCGLIYYCLMRPEEISQLKVHQVDPVRGLIRVTSAGTKDHTAEWITVPTIFMPNLLDHIGSARPSDHVMSKDFRPGAKRWLPVRYSEEWRNHRNLLGLPEEVRLYGLKDTALQRLAEQGVDLKRLRDHARHSNMAITDIYMRRLRGTADDVLKGGYPSL